MNDKPKEGENVSKKEIYEQKAEALIEPIVAAHGFELVDVEYVKEGSSFYLRAYIDKPQGITVEDCEVVSRAFSEKLDEEDFIEDTYIMEKELEIRTYRAVNREKEFYGILTAYDENSVTIDCEGEEKTFQKSDIALIRLAFDF